jgi:hypothetical protein
MSDSSSDNVGMQASSSEYLRRCDHLPEKQSIIGQRSVPVGGRDCQSERADQRDQLGPRTSSKAMLLNMSGVALAVFTVGSPRWLCYSLLRSPAFGHNGYCKAGRSSERSGQIDSP